MNTSLVRRPRYVELFECLRDRILAGELPPHSQLPTFVELRSSEGVSRGTVEQAYLRLEQEGLIRREQGRGTFVCGRQSTLKGQIGFIGRAYSLREQFPYAAHLVEGISHVLEREQLGMLLLRDDPADALERVDGVIIASGRPDQVAAEIAVKVASQVPVVALMKPLAGVPSVTPDDYGGGCRGARELMARGHRRISCLMQQCELVSRMRLRGVQDEMEAAGITLDAAWFKDHTAPFPAGGYRAWARAAMTGWLQDGWSELGCTALFAQNDLAAMGAIDAFLEAGLRVPGDVSVLGFDGTELCDFYTPRIAAVEVPYYQIGAVGVDLLLRQIRGENLAETRTMVPCGFKAGESLASSGP